MSFFFPHTSQVGQALGDFVAGAGDYGKDIPYVFGCIYAPEFRLWQQEFANVHPAGSGSGKGNLFGQPAAGSQNTYSGDYVSGFCLGPIPTFSGGTVKAIRRIMGDSTMLYDVSEQKTWLPTPETTDQMNARLVASAAFAAQMTIYIGSDTQTQDPNMVAALGSAVVPAFQNIVYISFKDVTWPNGRPSGLTAEICQSATLVGANQIARNSSPLATIFTTLLVDAGMSLGSIDVTAVSQDVRGVLITQSNRRAKMEDMMRWFDLDVCDSGGVTTFFPIDRAVAINIPFVDLSTTAVDENGDPLHPLEYDDIKETDLPLTVRITARNFDNDYVALPESYTNPIGTAQAIIEVDMGDFVATSTEILQTAQKQLFRAHAERYTYPSIQLPIWYRNLEPGDVITAVDDDNTVSTIRLKTVDLGAADGVIKCTGVRHSTFVSTLVGNPVYGGSVLADAGATTWEFMNLPPLVDSQAALPGVYIAATGASIGWVRGVLNQSKDGGATWAPVLTITAPAVIGVCSTILPSASPYVWDTTSSLTVTLDNPTTNLSSVTTAQALGNQNVALVGGEIIIFKTATLVSAGVYALTNFIRGRRGTESQIGTHGASENFVLLTGPGVGFLSMTYADIGASYMYKLVPNGHVLADETAQTHTLTGANMIPFSPANVQTGLTQSGSGPDLHINWQRRSRLGQVLTSGLVPLGEGSESYHFQIFTPGHAGVFLDRILSTPAFNYLHTDRAFDLGSPTASMVGYIIRVAQVSTSMGDGYSTELVLTAANSS